MMLTAFFENQYAAARGIEETTLGYYRKYLRRFDKWLERPATLADLTDEIMSAFFSTVPRARSAITPIWRFVVAGGLGPVVHNRQLLRPRRVHRSIDAWSKSQYAMILAAARSSAGVDQATGIPHAAYWVALVRTAHETKFPYGRLVRLTFAEAERLSLTRPTRDAIRDIKPETRSTLFGCGYSKSTFRNLRYSDFRRLVESALSRNAPEAIDEAPETSFASLINAIDD